MKALSINLRVADRLAVIVGGGRVAARRAATLLNAGAEVRLVAPEFCAELAAMQNVRLRLIERPYERGDLAEAFIAVAATDDEATNARVSADSASAGIFCNDASQPERGDFTLPAVAHQGAITIAVDTGGASPRFAKRLLDKLGAAVDPRAPIAAETLMLMRRHARQIASGHERRRILNDAAELPLEVLAAMSADEAREHIEGAKDPSALDDETASAQTVTCASRGSRLALAQTRSITAKLQRIGIRSRIVTIATHGDLAPDRPLSTMNAENFFVKEIEAALLDGRADYAVHSCKDLPSTLDSQLQLVAISAREDPRDAFCSERFGSFYDLPSGARVGTSSPRRRAQLMSLRSDLDYIDCRGNVDTRLRKLAEGQFDALVLAMAGLRRLNAAAPTTVAFEPEEIVPAVGQGALAIEMRHGDSDLHRTIRQTLNNHVDELAIVCERTALAALGGGCSAPIGIHARFDGETLVAHGAVCSDDGSQIVTARISAPIVQVEDASDLGERLAGQLLISGAAQLLAAEGDMALPLAGKLILLPRTQERASRISPALERAGARVLQVRGAEEALRTLAEQSVDMVVFPSSGAVDTVEEMFRTWRVDAMRPAIAAMGEKSANAARVRGVEPDVVADEPSMESLVQAVRQYFSRGMRAT